MKSVLLVFIVNYLMHIVIVESKSETRENCTLENGLFGQCMLFEFCPKERANNDDKSCGSGEFPDVCCEVKPEDLVEEPFGRIARRECLKNRNKYFDDWKRFSWIFGGEDAVSKEFTFMAALGYGSGPDINWSCGGTLFTDKHILTAAHCLQSNEDGPVKYVRLGDLQLNNDTDDASPVDFAVQKIIPHPEYKYPNAYNDIAILELNASVTFNDYIKPACLDVLKPLTGEEVLIATGWGYIDTNGERSTHLQSVLLEQKDFGNCSKIYPGTTKRLSDGLIDSQMCAGGKLQRKDTCLGDSGGPLARHNKHIRYESYKGYVLIGITSFGKLCGLTDAPGVYTKVRSYVPWIESVVWPEQI